MGKGISTIISTILMLIITISLVGTAWMYISGVFTAKTAQILDLVDVYQGSITVKNSGTANLPLGSLKIYVDNVETGFMSDKDSIPAMGTTTLTILNQIPVGIWHFDESSGTTAYDSSGNGNTGTLTNMNTAGSATSGWNSIDCKFGSCLKFDGVNDYINIPDSTSIRLTDAITVSLWAKLNRKVAGDFEVAISKDAKYQIYYHPVIDSYLCGVERVVSGWVTIDPGRAPTAGVWHHIVLTYDKNLPNQNFKCYQDGVAGTPLDTTESLSTSTNPLQIGVQQTTTDPFNGTIDEVKIWNRALTADEINSIYQKGPSERKNLKIVGPGNVISGFTDIKESNPTGISDWFSKVGRNTGKEINLCGWDCNDWINVKPDSSWTRGKYSSPVSSNWDSPPSQDSGYVVCCHYEDPGRNCAGCEITVWFKNFLVIPTTANKVWLRYSTDDPVRIYVDGNLFYERGCCCNPCTDVELTTAITKGKGNWITTKFYEGCWCGYFGGNIWYE